MKHPSRLPSVGNTTNSLTPSGLKSGDPVSTVASPPVQHPAVAAQPDSTTWYMVFLAIIAGILAGIFSLNLPWQGSFAFAFLLCCVGGIVPGCVLASVPLFSGSQVAAVNGMVVQGSNLGIVLGPILISSVVARYDWSFAPAVALTGALLGAGFVFTLSRCKQTPFASSVPAH